MALRTSALIEPLKNRRGSIPWSKINPETPIRLVRERFNRHDFEAVSVGLDDGTLLGYLRRNDNRIPAALAGSTYLIGSGGFQERLAGEPFFVVWIIVPKVDFGVASDQEDGGNGQDVVVLTRSRFEVDPIAD